MRVSTLWRYPVKSAGGERLALAELTRDGVRATGWCMSATPAAPSRDAPGTGCSPSRPRPGPDGEPLVEGHPWRSEEAAELIRRHGGPDAYLAAYHGPERFDITNLLVAVDGELDAFATRHGAPLDPRRLRPNIVLGGVAQDDLSRWPGSAVAVGDALIGVHARRQRCIVTSIDPDTGAQDLDVFRRIRRDFDGHLALDCWVIAPGTIRPGDRAELVPTVERPRDVGGWIVGARYAVDAASGGSLDRQAART